MNTIRVIIEYLSCFGEAALAMYFFSAFKERRFSIKKTLAIVLPVVCVYGTVLNFISAKNGVFLFSIAATLAIALCYSFRWYIAFFMTLILSVLSGLFELFVMQIVTFGGEFDTVNANIYVYIGGLSASKMLTYLMILLIRKGEHKSFQSVKNMRFAGLMMLPCSTVIVSMICSHLMFIPEMSSFWRILSTTAILFLIISNIMIFNIVDEQYELISTKEKLKASKILLENEKQYYSDVFQSHQEIRKTRHDLKNIFIALLGELNSQNTDEAKRMIQNKIAEMEEYIDIEDDSDNVIDAIIHSKMLSAKEKKVKLVVRKSIDRPILIDHLDLAVLIANVLDNAIEAASQVPKRKNVTFNLITDNDNLILLAENSTINIIKSGQELKTTKNDKKYHGYGILSIQSVAKKYDGNYIFECENNVFTSTIVLINRQISI